MHAAGVRPWLFAVIAIVACDRPAPSAETRAWVDRVEVLVPKMMCSPTGYFASCFPSEAARCIEIATAQFKDCVARHPEWLPSPVNKQTGEIAGQKLGACAGEQLEKELRKRGAFVDTPVCNDIQHWVEVSKAEAAQAIGAQ